MSTKLGLVLIALVLGLSAGFGVCYFYVEKTEQPGAKAAAPGTHGDHSDEDESAICPEHGVPERECRDCAVERVTRETLAMRKCEHTANILDCAECRWEAGVVKVEGGLLAGEHGKAGLIELAAVRHERPTRALRTVGQIALNQNRTAHVSARVAGLLANVKVELGQAVKEGETLSEIDSFELREALLGYVKTTAALEFAKKHFDREQGMFEKKISTQLEALDAQLRHEETKAERDMAEKKLLVLGITLERIPELVAGLGRKQELLPVTSPLAGVVLERQAVRGQRVAPETELFTVADLSTLWIWIDIYERDFHALLDARSEGRVPVRISVESCPGETFSGELDYVADVMTPETRTVKARVSLENTEKCLRPGMFATCEILLPLGPPCILVPRSALVRDEEAFFVFKQIDADLLARQGVEPGVEFSDLVEIVRGLDESDTVVTQGAFLLKSEILRGKMGEG